MRRQLFGAILAGGFGLVLMAGDASAAGCCLKKMHHAKPCPPPAPVCVVMPAPCPPPAPVCECHVAKPKHKLFSKCFAHKAKPAC